MAKELKNLRMVIFIKDNMGKESQMVMVNIIGVMEVTLKEILKRDSEMVMECGKNVQEIAINMKENILKIKSMDMESLVGQVEIFIREIILKI